MGYSPWGHKESDTTERLKKKKNLSRYKVYYYGQKRGWLLEHEQQFLPHHHVSIARPTLLGTKKRLICLLFFQPIVIE